MAEKNTVTIPIEIPRAALTVRASPPEMLSQVNVLSVCGIPPKQYLRMVRSAPVPVVRIGRLRLVDRVGFVGG